MISYATPRSDGFELRELERATDVLHECVKTYWRVREKALWKAIEKQEGRRPCVEEIARRAKRVIWPDGRSEWFWDNICILTEERAL